MTIRSLPSSSSSSSYSLASTSLSNRLETIFKKASELCTLCDIEACVIYYGPDGELKTWPKEREKVRDIALRYSQLNEALRRKKRVNLYDFLNKKKEKGLKNPNKKRKTSLKKVNELKYPISDHYSPDQISKLIQSLELNVSKVQERLRFVESQKQNETKPDHQGLASTSLNQQTQSLNPSQFSLFIYNHGDNTLSQIPVSASNFNQDFSALLQESEFKNQLVKQELCGYDQNMCMSNITNNSFQHPCVSNKEHYSAVQESVNNYELNQLMQKEFYGCDQKLSNINSNKFQHPCVSNTQHNSAVQESVDNPWLNQLMQHELYGFDQNLCSSDITNSNVPNPGLSNTVSYELGSDFLDSCGNMVGNTSFSQDMCSSYVYNFDKSSLFQTSTLPYLSTVPNSYLLSGNSS
ncbi:agamous-like MADS-box protein AGL75 [Arabidopsis lyrata subsp. lyrata]|uniref:agamous-like MADS-box protein AGL75 n=1 Tax=Arabidopsis lyrata subsp. lyrata TaxID=81972 RepID=UPI000A29C90C|nr:agamous-like MADS-box protein AGL75 [Arabidopsis lyrata subsp. lyrata]|eukprot:XP_020872955.1 agamous-like MADS-box protein AGL75 [Arabidopsis lyrata subsp. lyrata]